jgi:ribonuclease Z
MIKITFIGTSSCMPSIGSDTASFVLNDRHLVDTGWYAVLKMREYGIDPFGLESLVLTHLHHDHYMGLAPLLFYLSSRKRAGVVHAPLRILGPEPYLERVFDHACNYLQLSRFPELEVAHTLLPLSSGQSFELGGLKWETLAANHVSGRGEPEPALCYRVTEAESGAFIVFTGDTSFHTPLAGFAQGAQLLIHDTAHTSGRDAATIARMAGVGRLMLIHYSKDSAASQLSEARDEFPESYLAVDGETVVIGTG